MSYTTTVQISFLDEAPDFETVRAALVRAVTENQYHEDVLDDLSTLWAAGECTFNLFAMDIVGLMSEAAKASPDTQFSVRGWGEAPRDIWLRDYEGGAEVYSLGPPDDAV